MADRYRVDFTGQARADLAGIGGYIARLRGLDDAEALLDRLTDHIATLETFPLREPAPKELQETSERNVRQTQLGRYRIMYEVADDSVLVFLIADGRRDIQALLGDRLTRPDPPA